MGYNHDSHTRARVAGLLIVCLLMAIVAPFVSPAGTATAAEKSIKRGYFYTPPNDGTTPSTLANTSEFVIMSRGHEDYLDKMRGAGFNGDGLQYFVSGEVEGPGPYANSSASCNSSYSPLRNNVAYNTGDFCKYIHPNESWFLHNGSGKRLYGYWGSRIYYHMNPASPGWREFARSRMMSNLAGSSALGFDGIFLDNIEVTLYKAEDQLAGSDGTVKEFSSQSGWQSAWLGYLDYLTAELGDHGPVWGNMVADPNTGSSWNPYLKYLDGGMFESFATGYSGLSVTNWNNNLAQAEAALNMGKGVLMVGHGHKSETTKQTFAQASYLLVANGADAYFRFSESKYYTQWWQDSSYNVALGAPKGKRYQSGTSWRRDFECGYVIVDPGAKTGQITTTSCSSDPVPSPEPSPSVSIQLTGVSNGQTVAGVIDVEANVSPSTGVDNVTFFLDNQFEGYEGQAPYFLGGDTSGSPNGFDTTEWSDGQHTLKAVVTYTNGTMGSTQIGITVANDSPQPNPAVSVSLSGVSNGQTVSGTIDIEATATSSSAIDNIVFQLDGEHVGYEGLAPYFLGGDNNGSPNGFDTTQWSNGQHTLRAVATDTKGATGSTDVTINVANGTAQPIPTPTGPVKIEGVGNGQVVSGTITVEAVITEPINVDRVRFYLDNKLQDSEVIEPYYLGGDDRGAPYGFDTNEWSDGTHILKVTVTETNGATSSAEVGIVVSNGSVASSPTLGVSIAGVSNGQTVSGMINVEAKINSTVEVSRVRFYLDNQVQWSEGIAPYFLYGDDYGTPYGFDTTWWSDGQHKLSVIATDVHGGTTSAEISITVANGSANASTMSAETTATNHQRVGGPERTMSTPTVSLSGVEHGQSVSGVIRVEARVESTEEVNSVTFYLNGRALTDDYHAPFLLGGDDAGAARGFDTSQWRNGEHTLSVEIVDAGGGLATHEIEVVVTN